MCQKCGRRDDVSVQTGPPWHGNEVSIAGLLLEIPSRASPWCMQDDTSCCALGLLHSGKGAVRSLKRPIIQNRTRAHVFGKEHLPTLQLFQHSKPLADHQYVQSSKLLLLQQLVFHTSNDE
eukprot:TRINITY_DN62748_c0_g1_i1.p1 TRINITY_DN62748_c0_g1~~TRINITY_DN62748_c0_g1_i1.p1  ORF type:complete len:121 (+),score=13.22 TRINITY_DN62748_c0_g1_i1:297-659(+)